MFAEVRSVWKDLNKWQVRVHWVGLMYQQLMGTLRANTMQKFEGSQPPTRYTVLTNNECSPKFRTVWQCLKRMSESNALVQNDIFKWNGNCFRSSGIFSYLSVWKLTRSRSNITCVNTLRFVKMWKKDGIKQNIRIQ